MAYFKENHHTYYLEYSIYENKIMFVHSFHITKKYQGQGLSYGVFDILKLSNIPIVLECFPPLEGFYKKHGFVKNCITREGCFEMVWRPEGEKIIDYFGKKCKHFCGQWELQDREAAETYKEDIEEYEPILVFCNHPDQKETTEGNCRQNNCPLQHDVHKVEIIYPSKKE